MLRERRETPAICATLPDVGLESLGSGDDVPAQLAALMGRTAVQIRKTHDENPPRVSVIDVIAAIAGKSHDHASKLFRRMTERYDEVRINCPDFCFRGRGQRNTPVTDARGIVEILASRG